MRRTVDTSVTLDGHHLTLDAFLSVARHGASVTLSDEAKARMTKSFERVQTIAQSGVPTYGISTGFGELSKVYIEPKQNHNLQVNLLRSHASAVGPRLSVERVRGMMLLRLNTIAKGFSGANPALADLLVELLNRSITPVVPAKGSLGASGDLANLAHMALVLIGEGKALVDGEVVSGGEALRKAHLKPVTLSGKDGLALINGTQFITSVGALAVYDAQTLLTTATASLALSMEALRGITAAYLPEVQALRPHPGQAAIAHDVLTLLHGSSRIDSRPGDVQDAYTLRCAPQVLGAVKDALDVAVRVLETEMNAVNDNPLVLEDGRVVSGGHFHGEPLALVLDYAAIATSELASMAERRIERMVNPQLSGMTPFLTPSVGINSGYMIPQYVAAALVSENKILAHPASVDSIPSSANKEDHVSMGATAARKFADIVDNVRDVLAIELMVAAQAIDVSTRDGDRLAPATKRLYDEIRTRVKTLVDDRVLSDDIAALATWIGMDGVRHLCDDVYAAATS